MPPGGAIGETKSLEMLAQHVAVEDGSPKHCQFNYRESKQCTYPSDDDGDFLIVLLFAEPNCGVFNCKWICSHSSDNNNIDLSYFGN